jgi:ABC-type glycerol-3-phosphate transport system substrate-binding protein
MAKYRALKRFYLSKGLNMRALFLVILTILVFFSQVMVYINQSKTGVSNVPILYWVTDANPVRKEQVMLYRRWLSNRGLPDVDMRVDVNNAGAQKTIVQSVSGVAADVIDNAGGWVYFFNEMGVTESVDDLEARFGYPDSDRSLVSMPDYVIDGHQFLCR